MRSVIKSNIAERYRQVHRIEMSPFDTVCIFDIVNKLSRIAVTPEHIDSWKDVVGYATRILEMLEGDENANK